MESLASTAEVQIFKGVPFVQRREDDAGRQGF